MEVAYEVETYSLSDWLRDELGSRGLLTGSNQASTDAARFVGTERSVLNNILAGGKVYPENMLALSRAFKVSILDIMAMAGFDVSGAVGVQSSDVVDRLIAIKSANPEYGAMVDDIIARLGRLGTGRAKFLRTVIKLLEQIENEDEPLQSDE